MIISKDKKFVINTANSTYAFDVINTGHLRHLYYGSRLDFSEELTEFDVITPKREFGPGATLGYNPENPSLAFEDTCFEISSTGKGDLRSPFVSIVHEDGMRTSDFIYDSHEIVSGTINRTSLPGSYDANGKCETLIITLHDVSYPVVLKLYYVVYEEKDVITRFVDLINEGEKKIEVERLMSLQLDMDDCDYEEIFFGGAWAREMQCYR